MESKSNPEKTKKSTASNNIIKDAFSTIVEIMKKPVSGMKDKLKSFSEPKAPVTIACITVIVATLSGVISTLYNTVVSKKCYILSGKCETTVSWDSVGDIKWFDLIGRTLLMYVGAIAIASAVTFAVSRVMKTKSSNYWQLVSILSVAMLPLILCSLVGTLLGGLWSVLPIVFMVVGGAFSGYIYYEGVNNSLELDGDKKVFFHTINTFAIVVVALIALRLILGTSITNITSLFSM